MEDLSPFSLQSLAKLLGCVSEKEGLEELKNVPTIQSLLERFVTALREKVAEKVEVEAVEVRSEEPTEESH